MKKYYSGLISLILLASCTASRTTSRDDHKITVTFLQVNDVYEIAPLEGGKAGGFARVATVKKQLLEKNSNTYLVMAGDFLSPSVYNSLQYEGKRIRGKQMVETMNAAGTDFAIFGNHEFDISESELQSRINESSFQWISSNSFHNKSGKIKPFIKETPYIQPLPETYILNVSDADGTKAKIGIMAITLPFNKASYVSYTDPLLTAKSMYNRLKDSCDVVIAFTHQSIKDDIILAEQIPGLAMIVGGHEHDQRFVKVGKVIISKAMANAKSAYVLDLRINTLKHRHKINSRLQIIDEKISSDPHTDSVVMKWTAIAENSYASIGFDAKKIVLTSGESLEARETEIRSHPTNFSRTIISSMEKAAPQADVAILNAGSIRLDDELHMPVTQYDILRSLPFGGNISEVEMKGTVLIKTLEAGRKNIRSGGFLHFSEKVRYDSTGMQWMLNQQPINPAKIYRVAMTEFLITGGEANMEFLNKSNPDISKVYSPAPGDLRSDIRLAIIRYMEQMQR